MTAEAVPHPPATLRRSSPLLLVLATAAALRIAVHALFLPAYEGPDEMMHLARVLAFAERSPIEAFRGVPLGGDVVASVQARPCGPTVGRSFGCAPYGSAAGPFNLLHPVPSLPRAEERRNIENNQPPLYYAVVGLLLRGTRFLTGSMLASPDGALLFARLCSAVLAIWGVSLVATLARVRGSRGPALAAFGALALPGAADSLARCANDVAVFAWCAMVLVALQRQWRSIPLAVLIASGPLLKLTAMPGVAFAVATLWIAGARRASFSAGAASLAVFPVQLLRGWRWGGTWELNRPLPALDDGLVEIAMGLARSVYAFLKTTFWLGGWSFLRPPAALVLLFGVLLLAIVSRLRWTGIPLVVPHLVAAGAAALGFLMFAIANRRFYGVWGGVGGWYAWGWFPWLLLSALTLVDRGRRWPRLFEVGIPVFSVLANAAYFAVAVPAYS